MPRDLLAEKRAPRDLLAGRKRTETPQGTPGRGALELGATILTGAAGSIPAGIAGIARGIYGGFKGENVQERANAEGDTVRAVQDALTYRPRTVQGQAMVAAAAAPFELLTRKAGDVGAFFGGEEGRAKGEFVGTVVPGIAPLVKPIKAMVNRTPQPAPPPNEIVQASKDHKVPVHTSDIRQPKTFLGKWAQSMAEKVPVVGTAGMRRRQQAAREVATEEFVDQYSTYSDVDIIDSMKAQKNKVKSAAGRVIENTQQRLDQAGGAGLATPKTQAAVAQLERELTQPGVLEASPTALADARALVDKLSVPQTFSMLKKNRTAYRELKDAVDPEGRSQLSSRAQALAENVYRAMTQDMDDIARAHLTPKEFSSWKKANELYYDEAQKFTRTRLKGILDKGGLVPESYQGMLFSKKPSEVRMLYDSLTVNGRANARAAIISKVVANVTPRANGFSPNSFLTELKKHGAATDVFFRGKERQQLEGLRKLLEATRRAQDASGMPMTGYAAIPLIGLMLPGASVIGAKVAASSAFLARLYESAPVRNALIRLNSAQGASFDAQLASTRATIAATAQSIAAESSQQQEAPAQ